MQENKKFSHKPLEELTELNDLVLEDFEENQSAFVSYPDDVDMELDDIINFEEDMEDDLVALDIEESDVEDLDELVLEDLEADDELKADKRLEKTKSEDVAKAHRTLQDISKMLDTLIQVDEDLVSEPKKLEKLATSQFDKPERQRDYKIIDAEFKEITEKTDNLDKMLSKKRKNNVSDELVSDLYANKEWDLVLDEDLLLEKTEAVIDSVSATNETLVKAQGVEKKSFGALTTALLAGGGVLVFGLATAGVVTMVKSYRSKAQKDSTEIIEPVKVLPVATPAPVSEPEPEPVGEKITAPEPEPIKNNEPVFGDNLYRSMPPQYKYPPRPFWGIAPPPPPPPNNDDKDFAL